MARTKKEIEEDIRKTALELEDAKLRMPAHTVRPHQLMALEELEDRLDELKSELESLR